MRSRSRRRDALLVLTAIALLALVVAWRAPEAAAILWRLRAGHPEMSRDMPAPAAPLRWFDDYYVVGDMGQGAFAIGEPRYGQCNFSYLIVGTRRALLFDTGPGVRDITAVARALTSLPLEVLPSHLHFDHTGNLHRFADVALPDLPALRAQVNGGLFALGFWQSLGFVEGLRRRPFRVARWIPPGSEIDLGERRVLLVNVPGHTPESVVLLDRAANRMFAGDFIYPSQIYAFLPGADLADYAASARRVFGMINDQTQVLGAHGCDRPGVADVPSLTRADIGALAASLSRAAETAGPLGKGWFPRIVPVNDRMILLAKYPWMPD